MRAGIFILLLLVLAVGGYLLFAERPAGPGDVSDGSSELLAKYSNDAYGISFEYPRMYTLREMEVGNAERARYSIVLADAEALRNLPQNGEGPPTVTIDFFQNNLDELSVEEWVRGTNFSNFKLSPDGALASTTVAGTPALSYTWDGLYRGKSVVLAHKGNIVMLSVQMLSPEDKIVSDFQEIVSSFELR